MQGDIWKKVERSLANTRAAGVRLAAEDLKLKREKEANKS